MRNSKYVYLLVAILAASWITYAAAPSNAANKEICVEKAFPEGQWSRVIIHLRKKTTRARVLKHFSKNIQKLTS